MTVTLTQRCLLKGSLCVNVYQTQKCWFRLSDCARYCCISHSVDGLAADTQGQKRRVHVTLFTVRYARPFSDIPMIQAYIYMIYIHKAIT